MTLNTLVVLGIIFFGLVWHDASSRPVMKRSAKPLNPDDKQQNKGKH